MKISWNFEQSENEYIEEQKQTASTINNVVEKILNFGERFMSMIAADKAASRASFKDDQISQLARTVEILSSKLDRMENKINSSNETFIKFKNNK